MASKGSDGRKRWTERKKMKEPSLYDEYLKQEQVTQNKQERRQSVPLRRGDTTASAISSDPTIRAVTPDSPVNAHAEMEKRVDSPPIVPGRGTSSFDRFTAYTTTTIVGGPAALASSSSAHSDPKPRKLVKERGTRTGSGSHGSSSTRKGSSAAGMLGRNTSKTNGHSSRDTAELTSPKSSRSRKRVDEEQERTLSPTNIGPDTRDRTGSMDISTSPSSGAEYLASVPAEISPPSAPSIKSIGSGVHNSLDLPGRRSTSPDSSSLGESKTSSRGSSARRILHLMKTLNGRYSGNVLLRRGQVGAWSQIYCYIREDSGDLMYEPRGGEGAHRTLVSGLRGCGLRPLSDGDTPYLEVTLPDSDTEVHLKLLTQVDFDSWYAALLYWQSLGPEEPTLPDDVRSPSSNSTSLPPAPPEPPPRTSSARHRRDRKGSGKSERRKHESLGGSLKEAPVIKVGRMIYWDTSMGRSHTPNPSGGDGHATSSRPKAIRMQSDGTRRWRRISGQLRENGELKLHSDTDNSLISVVQLSQLSRCAIQKLDQSVMDDEYCIAIYPQYTSTPSDTQTGFMRPIFLSLENRVLHEVWFVLLRAFAIPQLYGPEAAKEGVIENNETETDQEYENGLATTTTDMFRMERSLNIRIIEAKMYPPSAIVTPAESGPTGTHNKTVHHATAVKPEQHGLYAEILLDNETRAKTAVKFDGLAPLWGESFEFLDLPSVLNSARVVIKRRPPDAHAHQQQESRLVHEAYRSKGDSHGGFSPFALDVACGKIEIYLQELEDEKEIEKWWPVNNMHHQRVGEMLIKARADEDVILMARDYEPLGDILHRFSNGITLQIAQMVPSDLKRVSDCLLNIFQVSGKAGDWIMALAEEEIDGLRKETPITRLRWDRRVESDVSNDALGTGGQHSDRELLVRDMGKHATFEANLLFRGNTLLTKSLDTHMRRVGKEYLEESLGTKLRDINEMDADCEVDPNRVASSHDMDRNWVRLLRFTQEVWRSIVAAKDQCPIELRIIFRHIRACAEDRYGDFLRSVSYSSVSGFLFLRFFCPAVLNPKLFGLLSEDLKPRARRTFTLIAKALQTLSNMASFGSKEIWMEPMNAFLTQHRSSFKSFIDDVCYVPAPLSAATHHSNGASPSTYPPGTVSADTSLSYTTPTTIMQRLPPTSREGFPSLPFLIDQPRAFAELVEIWLDATTAAHGPTETTASAKSHTEVMTAIKAAGGDLMTFHKICATLSARTQDCLSRAERAERPNSASSFRWDEMIDQLKLEENDGQLDNSGEMPILDSLDSLAERIGNDPSITIPASQAKPHNTREWDVVSTDMDEMLSNPSSQQTERPPTSSGIISTSRRAPRPPQSQGSDSSGASISDPSTPVSTDTEHTTDTTALPNYERELRHRERREAAKQEIKSHVAASKVRESEDRRKKVRAPIVSALRKKNQREGKGGNGNAAEGYTSYGL